VHLESADALLTSYEAVRAGFVELALEKNRRATPFIEQARALKIAAAQAATAHDLLNIADIQAALLTAAGLSDKAIDHLQIADKETAKARLIEKFLEPAGVAFVEELVYRFLLTRGDTLGGSMRNAGGAMAQRKLVRALISALAVRAIDYWWLHGHSNQWLASTAGEADIENMAHGLSWRDGQRQRTVRFNLTVPLVKNNVDVALLGYFHDALKLEIYTSPSAYIALGELKGALIPLALTSTGKPLNLRSHAFRRHLPNIAQNRRCSSLAQRLRRRWQPKSSGNCTINLSRMPLI